MKPRLISLMLFVCVAAVAVHGCAWTNVHVVARDEVVRSAQLTAPQFASLTQKYHLRSVLNLRGAFPGERWYDDEVAASQGAGLEHYDYELSSDFDVSLDQQRALVELLKNAPKPLLIHCNWGADRTGLVSALYRYSILHDPPEDAVKELSPWYGHVTLIHRKALAMDRSFAAFVAASR